MKLKDILFATVIGVILVAIIIKIHGSRYFDKERRYDPLADTVMHQMFNFHRLSVAPKRIITNLFMTIVIQADIFYFILTTLFW